jgi:hypothetical protein
VPEGRGVFAELTVAENLMLGAHPRRARADEKKNHDAVLTLFPRLRERMKQAVRTMSGGEQQMVDRRAMSAPEVLPSTSCRCPLLAHELLTRWCVSALPGPRARRTERAGEPPHRRPRLPAGDRADRR